MQRFGFPFGGINYFHFIALATGLTVALSYATQHSIPREFGGNWGTGYLNTRFPLPTLLYSEVTKEVKDKQFYYRTSGFVS